MVPLKRYTYIPLVYRAAELYEYAMLPEHLTSVDPSIYPTTISDTGALSCSSGLKTGRTPKEKRVVLDETTKDVSLCDDANSQPTFDSISLDSYLMCCIDNLVGQCEHSHLS